MDLTLKRLSLKRFKAFAKADLELAPITILVGINSSGKSSLLQPLLLLKQTFDSLDNTSPLILNGSLIDLGTFSDIAYNHKLNSSLAFEFYWNLSGQMELLPFFQKLSVDEISGLKVKFEMKYSKKGKHIYLSKFDCVLDEESVLNASIHANGKAIYGSNIFNKTIDSQSFMRNCLPFPPEEFANIGGLTPEKYKTKTGKKLVEQKLHLLGKYTTLMANISYYFSNIRYLGPLRDRPQHHYFVKGERRHDVGSRGEYAVDMLVEQEGGEVESQLIDAINEWFPKWGIAGAAQLSRLTKKESAKPIYSLDIKDPTTSIFSNLPNVGFGISQILPVLIACYRASKNSLIIIEEPEIHLNPKVQAGLADMFLKVAEANKHFIIETHSEHLILRFQKAVAEGLDPNLIRIYYVGSSDKAPKNRVIKRIEIGDDGVLKKWPEGFLEEDFEDNMTIMKASFKHGDNSNN